MMKSLKQELLKLILILVALLATLFSSLMYLNLQFGLATDTRNTMLFQAKLVEKATAKAGALPVLINSEILSVYADFEQMPEYIQGGFSWADMSPTEMREDDFVNEDGEAKYVYAMRYQLKDSNQIIYITSSYDEDIEQAIEYERALMEGNSEHVMLGLGLMLATLFLFILTLYIRLLKPIKHLLDWLKHNTDDRCPDSRELKFSELCLLADELAMNRKKMKESIERESFFLNTLSHELRTPIAIISSSGELLERVTQDNDAAQRATNRVMYAVKNMNLLVRTLLWVARKSEAKLELSRVDLPSLIAHTLSHNEYLLTGKNLSIEVVEVEPSTELIESYGVVQLVLENLIRNAIEHAEQGEIKVELFATSVQITNATTNNDSEPSTKGIGLELVKKVCQNRAYQFEFSTTGTRAKTIVDFRP